MYYRPGKYAAQALWEELSWLVTRVPATGQPDIDLDFWKGERTLARVRINPDTSVCLAEEIQVRLQGDEKETFYHLFKEGRNSECSGPQISTMTVHSGLQGNQLFSDDGITGNGPGIIDQL